MPRIRTSASDPIDFCRQHMPTEAVARERYENLGDGPDGRGNCFAYDDDHPDYDGEQYRCAHKVGGGPVGRRCNRLLTAADNSANW